MSDQNVAYRYFYSYVTRLGIGNAVVDLSEPILNMKAIKLIQSDIMKIKGVDEAIITSYQLIEG